MKKLFFTIFIVFAFAIGAYAQPINPVSKHLVVDTITDPTIVTKSEVQDFEISLPEARCIYDPQNGQTRVYFLEEIAPGPHSYRVRVQGEDTVIENADGSVTVTPGAWSGWSNVLDITKPYILELSILDGFLVAPFQAGMISSNVYINDTNYAGLVEPTTDGQYLRLYNIQGFSPGTYNIWANVTYSVDGINDGINEWEGDYQANPFVVTVQAPVLQAPANLRIQ